MGVKFWDMIFLTRIYFETVKINNFYLANVSIICSKMYLIDIENIDFQNK